MNWKSSSIVVLLSGMLGVAHTGAQTLSWCDEAPLLKPGRGLGFAALNGELYAAGGTCGWKCQLATLDTYNPVANTWTSRAAMLTNRVYPAAAALNGKLYVSGGAHDEDGLNITLRSTEVYDPLNNSWIARANLRDGRDSHCAVALNGRIYVLGGQYSGGQIGSQALSSLEEYDPVADVWVRKANMPVARVEFGAVVFGGKIYVFGGWNNAEPHGIAAVYSYTPASDSWATNASLPTPRTGLAAVVTGGSILTLGGSAYDGTFLRSCAVVEEYDPLSDRWTTRPGLPFARGDCYAACVEAPARALYVCGWGYNDFTLQAASLLPPLEIRGDLELRFQGESGMTYQLQASPDLVAWTNFDGSISCSGGVWSKTYSPPAGGKLFFRLTQP